MVEEGFHLLRYTSGYATALRRGSSRSLLLARDDTAYHYGARRVPSFSDVVELLS